MIWTFDSQTCTKTFFDCFCQSCVMQLTRHSLNVFGMFWRDFLEKSIKVGGTSVANLLLSCCRLIFHCMRTSSASILESERQFLMLEKLVMDYERCLTGFSLV